MFAGERVTVFGGLRFPAGRFELGLWDCAQQDCQRHLWKPVEGPGDVWGSLGSVDFEEPGPAEIVLRAYRRGGTAKTGSAATGPADQLVATWRRDVTVTRAPATEGQAGSRDDVAAP